MYKKTAIQSFPYCHFLQDALKNLPLRLMIEQPLLRQLFIFCARPAVIAIRVNADSAARSEDTSHLDVFGVHQADKVFHDDIDAILMKGSVVAETEQI